MGIEATHPQYDLFSPDWIKLRDFYKGERQVKSKGITYLPPTAGMLLDGYGKGIDKPGQIAYDAYKGRALFPDYVKEGVEALVGMLHQKPPTFELPPEMKDLETKCTLTGESLQDLLRIINSEQLLTGRIGLLADLPAEVPTEDASKVLPYIATYVAESIKNWDESDGAEGFSALNLVILDESGFIRDTDFTWKEQKRFRLLQLGDISTNEPAGTADYMVGVFKDTNGGTITYSASNMKTPMLRGVSLKEIPFVFANTRDIIAAPDDPPLLGLGNLCLAIYRGEADYRQNLFMQGQDTLVVIGGTRDPEGVPGDDGALRTGAGSRIDVDMGGDAKYVGVSGKGLTEQREALTNDRKAADSKAGRLIPIGKKDAESGEALKTRVTAQTATLNQIAITGGKALENILKLIGKWLALSDEVIKTIKVNPNTEFGDFEIAAQDIVDLMTARSMGAPISRKSIHDIMKDRGITKLKYEDELALVEEENANMPPPAGTAGGMDPGTDPHLTNEDGTPMNKDQLEIERERRAEARDNRAAKRDARMNKGAAGAGR